MTYQSSESAPSSVTHFLHRVFDVTLLPFGEDRLQCPALELVSEQGLCEEHGQLESLPSSQRGLGSSECCQSEEVRCLNPELGEAAALTSCGPFCVASEAISAALTDPVFQNQSVSWWAEALGDRIPTDWPVLPIFVERYVEEVLLPALCFGSAEPSESH